jgi:hypothetical protein
MIGKRRPCPKAIQVITVFREHGRAFAISRRLNNNIATPSDPVGSLDVYDVVCRLLDENDMDIVTDSDRVYLAKEGLIE